MVSSPSPWHGVGFDPSSQEEVLGKISKMRGTNVQIFGCLDTFVGLNGKKLLDKLTQKRDNRIQIQFKYLKLYSVHLHPTPQKTNIFFFPDLLQTCEIMLSRLPPPPEFQTFELCSYVTSLWCSLGNVCIYI